VVSLLWVGYRDGQGILRQVIRVTTQSGFAISELTTHSDGRDQAGPGDSQAGSLAEAGLPVCGKRPTAELATRLSGLPNVRAVTSDMLNAASRLGDGSRPAYILADVR
jgi:acetolactate synthase regulatory subunit